jgi:ABC-type branched-subunit amino acid transport system substrate-binding protein
MTPVRIGALVPLSRPGWTDAGENVVAGLELAVSEINDSGGVGGRAIEIVVRDTAADPKRAVAAMDEFAAKGVTATVGEYHSVVARDAAARADAVGMPFLCTSAVLDALTEYPSDWVARLAPVQSRGWRIFAEYLLDAGHRTVAVAADASVYWSAGTQILRDRFQSRGGDVRVFETATTPPDAICGRIAEHGATALILLLGYPDPAVSYVRSVRRDPRTAGILLGAPAGQPEFPGWAAQLGEEGAGIPFLRYLPEQMPPSGQRVGAALRQRLGGEPSFTAFEGYDAVLVLASMIGAHGPDRQALSGAWSAVDVEGTRGRIRFSRVPGVSVWQWDWPPIQIADRDLADPTRFRLLQAG